MRTCGFGLCLILITGVVGAADPAAEYLRDVKPILEKRCFACHAALKQQAELRLDTGAAIRRGGSEGPAVKPGDPAGSLVIERVSATDAAERMPPEGAPLTAEEIATLTAWIKAGAASPENEKP